MMTHGWAARLGWEPALGYLTRGIQALQLLDIWHEEYKKLQILDFWHDKYKLYKY